MPEVRLESIAGVRSFNADQEQASSPTQWIRRGSRVMQCASKTFLNDEAILEECNDSAAAWGVSINMLTVNVNHNKGYGP
jgi:hypothetical protein